MPRYNFPAGGIAGNDGYNYTAVNTPALLKVRESAPLCNSNGIQGVVTDGTYIYVADAIMFKVHKLDAVTLEKVAESASYGGMIYAMCISGSDLYIGGGSTQKVYKLNTSNLAKTAESIAYGGLIRSIAVSENYVYCGGGSGTYKVYKLNTSDLVKQAESPDYGGDIYSIVVFGSYVYYGGASTLKVYKANVSDLSKVAESSAGVTAITTIVVSGTSLYVVGIMNPGVVKMNQSDLAVTLQLPFDSSVGTINVDNTYLYVGIGGAIYMYTISNNVYSGQSGATPGVTIGCILVLNNYVYTTMSFISRVFKYDALGYVNVGYRRF